MPRTLGPQRPIAAITPTGLDNGVSRLFEHDVMGERDGFDAYETDAGLSMQWDCKTPLGFE